MRQRGSVCCAKTLNLAAGKLANGRLSGLITPNFVTHSLSSKSGLVNWHRRPFICLLPNYFDRLTSWSCVTICIYQRFFGAEKFCWWSTDDKSIDRCMKDNCGNSPFDNKCQFWIWAAGRWYTGSPTDVLNVSFGWRCLRGCSRSSHCPGCIGPHTPHPASKN